MKKTEKLYEGKAKKLFATDEPGFIIQEFKDDATAFDGKKKGTIKEKGKMNNLISATLFQELGRKGVKTHFVKLLSPNDMLCHRLDMISVEVIVRNIAAGSLAKRIGYEEGRRMRRPVVEFYYKSDELGDPLLIEDHIFELGLTSPERLSEMKEVALKVNDVLVEFFKKRGLNLVDFKLEFGEKDTELILADEISPDTCRLWDIETDEKMDKDRFRRDLGKIEEAYKEVLRRVEEQI